MKHAFRPSTPGGGRGAFLLCFFLWQAAASALGDVARTYTDSGRVQLRQGVAVQHFVVPYGCTGRKFEFYCDAGTARGLPDHEVALQIYSADREHLATSGVKFRDLTDRRGWVMLDDLALEPGAYYAQLFSNSTALSPHLKARLVSGSGYRGGHAATGWQGGRRSAPAGTSRRACRTTRRPPRRRSRRVAASSSCGAGRQLTRLCSR
ncbi:MAG TPA: hypothetical protein QGH10_05150 [Armatimonadota bacterium]|nr:hypothetical protein [Armatimonadota bacterium]